MSLRIFITEDIMNRVEIYIFLSFKHTTQVGTDALVCPPIYPYVSSRQATSSPFEGLGEVFAGCFRADRRGRLSLLCGIPLDRKNYSNRLSLGAPPLGGGWVGFPDEGVCPYSVALSLIKGTPLSKQRNALFALKRAFLCNEKGVSSHRRNALFVC